MQKDLKMYILKVTKDLRFSGHYILMDDNYDASRSLEAMLEGDEECGWSLHSCDATILHSLKDVQALRDYLELNRDLICEILSIKAGI